VWGIFPNRARPGTPLSSFFSKKNRASFPNEMFHDAQNVPRSKKKFEKKVDRTKKIVIL